MNSLPIRHTIGPEEFLGAGSLELTRQRIQLEISNNESLNQNQKDAIIAELDFLIAYRRLSRLRSAIRQWHFDEFVHKSEIFQKGMEYINRLKITRARVDRIVAKMHRDAMNYRLEIAEKILAIKKKYSDNNDVPAAQRELRKLKLKEMIARKREQAFHSNVAQRSVNRARFIKMVEKEFPDMADEMIDFYDRQIFNAGARL